MAKVIIFGLNDFAELAHYYLENDSEHEVVAFSVNREFIGSKNEFYGKPIFAFEEIENFLGINDYLFFAPMSPKGMNSIRKNTYYEIKSKGYNCISYVSSKATVFNNRIGENCFILENNVLQPFTNIGNNVVLWSGNHIGHHGLIKDHCFFTSHVVMSGHCQIGESCFLGVNSTIRDGLTLAEGTLLAMHSSLNKGTQPWSVYLGSPAVKKEGLDSSKVL